jgi:regulator of protease activity HflC (stomatin/prohibitin superfamily)
MGLSMTASELSYYGRALTGCLREVTGVYRWRAKFIVAYLRYRLTVCLGFIVTAFLIVAFWPWMCVTVPAGYVAIKWYRFLGGTDSANIYGEGSRFTFPWDKVEIYEARVQQISRDFDVLTLDGPTMTINIAIRFRVNRSTVGQLHKNVGPDYVERLLIPAVGSYARQVFSQNSTDSVYTSRRSSIQEEVKQAVIADLSPRLVESTSKQDRPWISVEDVLIRSMRFPPAVQAAIDRKMEQQQLKQEYAYRLESERLESERKEVEAQGIAKFQAIVRGGISESYLRWKGIDATLALAQSTNSKVVLIGTPSDGMPLILGGDPALSGRAVERVGPRLAPTDRSIPKRAQA